MRLTTTLSAMSLICAALTWTGLSWAGASCDLGPISAAENASRTPATLPEFDAWIRHFERRHAAGTASIGQLDQLALRYGQRFQALKQARDLARAEAVNAIILERSPHHAAALLRTVQFAIARHDFPGARQHLATAESVLDARSTQATRFDVAIESGDHASAERALRALERDSFAYHYRAARWADLSGHGDAEAHFDTAIRMARAQSMHPLALANLLANRGVMALHGGDREQACEQFAAALTINPRQPAALEWIARDAWHRGDSAGAQVLIGTLQAHQPDNAALLHLAADIAASRNRIPAAGEYHAAAVRAYKRHPDLYRLNHAEYLLTQPDGAREALGLLLHEQSRRDSREVHNLLALAYLETGDIQRALVLSDSVASSGALHPPLALNRARVLAAAGRASQTTRLLEIARDGAVELHPAWQSQL